MKLFKLLDETVGQFNSNVPIYEKTEKEISDFLISIVSENENYIGSSSRVKNDNSLRSKIVARKYYLDHDTPQAIIDCLTDVIGITLECRFKEDELELFKQIKQLFNRNGTDFSRAMTNDKIYLNLNDEQPQKQKNGFDIYRIDGYYLDNDHRINFELQIKSLINTFWSGIEHEVIYKNNNYILYDSFLRDLLMSVKSNLDTIDFQLAQIYNQMTNPTDTGIGMDGNNFKSYLGKEINNLFSYKLEDAVEIEVDIKKISALISHYIYLEDFIKSESPQIVLIDYFEKLNLLGDTEIDFTQNIELGRNTVEENIFDRIVGNFFLDIMNEDFDWHVLITILLHISDDDPTVNFNTFVSFLRRLLLEPGWFSKCVEEMREFEGYENIENEILEVIATSLVKSKSIDTIYEENLYEVMLLSRSCVEDLMKAVYNKSQSKTDILDQLKVDIEKVYSSESEY